MFDFISGLLIDLSLITGIILLIMSFTTKFKKHKSKMIIAGMVLIGVGLTFFDTTALYEAYQNGVDWGKNN